MAASKTDPMTSIPVHSSTLKMLQPFRKGDMTWDDVMLDFLEEHLPEEFLDVMAKKAEELPSIPWEEVRKGLSHRGE